jgi:hypothetical protein
VDGRLEFGDVAWRVAYVARLAPGGCAFHVLKTRVFTLKGHLTNEPLGLNTNRTEHAECAQANLNCAMKNSGLMKGFSSTFTGIDFGQNKNLVQNNHNCNSP